MRYIRRTIKMRVQAVALKFGIFWRKSMDFYKVPIGFGMALAMNAPAMEAYAAMTEQQKQTILNKAHNARSEKEMHQIVEGIAKGSM